MYHHAWNQRVREVVGACHIENMGRNLRFWTLEICLPYHESPSRTLGTPNAALATFWKRTSGTSSNELEDQICMNHFLDWSIGVIGRRWLQILTGGWWRRTSSSNFVHNRRIRLTGCLYFPTFRPGSRPKVGCFFGMRTSDSDYFVIYIFMILIFIFIFILINVITFVAFII